MPGGDGTGPTGQGPGTERGSGQDSRKGRLGSFKAGAGPSGNCVCPSCGAVVAHERGKPCYQKNCPKCGAKMTRQ